MNKSSNISKWVFGVLALISVAIVGYFFLRGIRECNRLVEWDKNPSSERLFRSEPKSEINLNDQIDQWWSENAAIQSEKVTNEWVTVTNEKRVLAEGTEYTYDTLTGVKITNTEAMNLAKPVKIKVEPPTPITNLLLNWSYVKILLGILAILISAIVVALLKGVNVKTILIVLGAIIIIGGVSYLMSKGAFQTTYYTDDPDVFYGPKTHGLIEWGINFFYVTLGVSFITILYSVIRSYFK